jgi:hypothetical protein
MAFIPFGIGRPENRVGMQAAVAEIMYPRGIVHSRSPKQRKEERVK